MEADLDVLKESYKVTSKEEVLSEAAKRYLRNTDFFELRELRGGKKMPDKVRRRRNEAMELSIRNINKRFDMLDEYFYNEKLSR